MEKDKKIVELDDKQLENVNGGLLYSSSLLSSLKLTTYTAVKYPYNTGTWVGTVPI
jgi:hypothetical protein